MGEEGSDCVIVSGATAQKRSSPKAPVDEATTQRQQHNNNNSSSSSSSTEMAAAVTKEKVLAKLTASQDFDAFVESMGFSSEPEQQPERSLWKNYFSGAKAAIEADNGDLFVDTMITYVIDELDKWEAAKAKAAAAQPAQPAAAQAAAAQPAQPAAAQEAAAQTAQEEEAAQPAAEQEAAAQEAQEEEEAAPPAAEQEEAATPPPLPAAIEQWMVDTGIRKIVKCHGNCVAISHLVPWEIVKRDEKVKEAHEYQLVNCFGWRKDADGKFMALPTLEQCEQWIEAYKIAHPKEDLNFSDSEEEASESEEEYSSSEEEEEEEEEEDEEEEVSEQEEEAAGQKRKADDELDSPQAAKKPKEEQQQIEKLPPIAASAQAAIIDLTKEAPAEKAQVMCTQCERPITTSVNVVANVDHNEAQREKYGYKICGRCAHSYPFA